MKEIDHSSLNILLQDAQHLHDRIVQMTRDFDLSSSQRGSAVATKDNPAHDSQSCKEDEFSVTDGSSCQSAKIDFVDELAKPTVRYKKTAQPGIPHFRNDPVKRYEIYKEQWAKFPAPGEDKRLGLRWKVRDFMSRQDIPDLPKSA